MTTKTASRTLLFHWSSAPVIFMRMLSLSSARPAEIKTSSSLWPIPLGVSTSEGQQLSKKIETEQTMTSQQKRCQEQSPSVSFIAGSLLFEDQWKSWGTSKVCDLLVTSTCEPKCTRLLTPDQQSMLQPKWKNTNMCWWQPCPCPHCTFCQMSVSYTHLTLPTMAVV